MHTARLCEFCCHTLIKQVSVREIPTYHPNMAKAENLVYSLGHFFSEVMGSLSHSKLKALSGHDATDKIIWNDGRTQAAPVLHLADKLNFMV